MYQQLDETTAYFKGRPIRNSDELSSPLITSPVDPEWNDRIKSNWWYHSNQTPPRLAPGVKFDDRLFELRDKLLSFGGSEVCLPVTEQDLSQILERGQLWHGDRVRFMRGQPSQCHRNSSYCWHANKDITTICTGYALSEDGLWRQHSWVIHIRPRKNQVIETTVGRVAYFGFAMTPEEANQFYFDNE